MVAEGFTIRKLEFPIRQILHHSEYTSITAGTFNSIQKILLQSLRALCLAAGGPESIRIYSDVLVRLTGVCGRLVCGFRTDLHCADTYGVKA
jgi:hypothetical protein